MCPGTKLHIFDAEYKNICPAKVHNVMEKIIFLFALTVKGNNKKKVQSVTYVGNMHQFSKGKCCLIFVVGGNPYRNPHEHAM